MHKPDSVQENGTHFEVGTKLQISVKILDLGLINLNKRTYSCFLPLRRTRVKIKEIKISREEKEEGEKSKRLGRSKKMRGELKERKGDENTKRVRKSLGGRGKLIKRKKRCNKWDENMQRTRNMKVINDGQGRKVKKKKRKKANTPPPNKKNKRFRWKR